MQAIDALAVDRYRELAGRWHAAECRANWCELVAAVALSDARRLRRLLLVLLPTVAGIAFLLGVLTMQVVR